MPDRYANPEINGGGTRGRAPSELRAALEAELDGGRKGSQEPPVIPDHRLLRRIGRGSFGEVWLAENALGTRRAVKIVYRAWFEDERPYEREFEGILKYEPISRTHEGLIQVLHVGRSEQNACFFYVMELADAETDAGGDAEVGSGGGERKDRTAAENYRPRSLRSELAVRIRLPAMETAQIGLSLAEALRHLHSHQLVHRDIKPSNVIFVGGRPKLADIGLVTDLNSSQSYVGTEGFIPPEGPGSPEADLYALGKLLYELSSGRDRMDFPALPEEIGKRGKANTEAEAYLELNEVMTRACAPERRSRYHTATAFVADLNLFLAGRSLRRARNLEIYLTQLKRLAAAACILFLLTAVGLWISRREEQRAKGLAEREMALRRRVEVAEREGRQQLYSALLEQARANVRSGEVGHRVRTLEAIRHAATIANKAELRREVVAALALPDLRFERDVAVGNEISFRSLDPKFERIAVGRGRGPVEIRSVRDERLLATLPASTNLMGYVGTWSRDGRYLMVKRDYDAWGWANDVEVWDVERTNQVLVIRDARWNARSFHPTKPWLLIGGGDEMIHLWDLERGVELSRKKFEATPEALMFAPDGMRVAATYWASNRWEVSIHSAEDGALIHSVALTNRAAAIDWHPDGKWLAVCDYGGEVQLIDSTNGEVRKVGRHKAEAVTVQFTPQGDYLFTGGWEREFMCWDMRTLQRVMSIGLDSYIVQFRADGGACGLVGERQIALHHFERPVALRRFEENLGPRARHAAFSPDSMRLAASADKKIGVWDLRGETPGKVVNSGTEARLFWAGEEDLLGSSYDAKGAKWRIISGSEAWGDFEVVPVDYELPTDFRSLCVFSNRVVWTRVGVSGVSAVDVPEVSELVWSQTVSGISGASVDGRYVGMFQPYGTVLYIYELPEMRAVAALTNRAWIGGFSFSPDGAEIAVGSRGQIEFWATKTWKRTGMATNFTGLQTIGILYQPDGRSAWMARDLRTSGLFDLKTMEPLVYLPTGTLPLAVSPNGRYLAVTEDLQRLQVWDLELVRREFEELGLGGIFADD